VLGLIIEKVTGHSWAHEVEARLLQPLGLQDTAVIEGDAWKLAPVPGYIRTTEGYLSSLEFPWYPHPSTAWAAGGMISSASDLMTFATALFDGQLVSRQTLATMAQPIGTEDRRAFALGGVAIDVAGHKAFGMAGDSGTGYHAFFIGLLDSKLAVTALVNTEAGNVIAPSLTALKDLSQPIETD
jgi:CubicO group peptidase (beta-lactamase class C family)